jgi:hypothetical protein
MTLLPAWCEACAVACGLGQNLNDGSNRKEGLKGDMSQTHPADADPNSTITTNLRGQWHGLVKRQLIDKTTPLGCLVNSASHTLGWG